MHMLMFLYRKICIDQTFVLEHSCLLVALHELSIHINSMLADVNLTGSIRRQQ